jgi:hypothetical protein
VRTSPLGAPCTNHLLYEERLMPATATSVSARSLIDIHVGERVAVGAVLFDVVRHHCSSVGIQPGVVMRCECSTNRSVWLRRDDGIQIELDRVYAAFVEVEPLQ